LQISAIDGAQGAAITHFIAHPHPTSLDGGVGFQLHCWQVKLASASFPENR
jgi:hypothetical protein